MCLKKMHVKEGLEREKRKEKNLFHLIQQNFSVTAKTIMLSSLLKHIIFLFYVFLVISGVDWVVFLLSFIQHSQGTDIQPMWQLVTICGLSMVVNCFFLDSKKNKKKTEKRHKIRVCRIVYGQRSHMLNCMRKRHRQHSTSFFFSLQTLIRSGWAKI